MADMEQYIGLGNPIGQDATLDAATLKANTMSSADRLAAVASHTTVFVSASNNDASEVCFKMEQPNECQERHNNSADMDQPQASVIKEIKTNVQVIPSESVPGFSVSVPSIMAQQQQPPLLLSMFSGSHSEFLLPPKAPPHFPMPSGLPPSFSATLSNNIISQSSLAPHSAVPALPHTSHTEQPTTEDQFPKELLVPPFQDSIEKARSIALRFHLESTQRRTNDSVSVTLSAPDTPSSSLTLNNYAQQRSLDLQKENTKFQTFRLKNLEYVMKHEELELRRHVECMNQVSAYEERQSLQRQWQQQQLIQRKLERESKEQQKIQVQLSNTAGGGIGSKEQRRAERVKKIQSMDQGPNSSQNEKNGAHTESTHDDTIRSAIYLTNLPTDGSTSERALHALFGSYGRLDRVTMYRHRSNGELKGDGLIVFGRDAVKDYRKKFVDDEWKHGNICGGTADLVEAVCLQMNGAELPCGTIIGVQVADLDYKRGIRGEKILPSQASSTDVVEESDTGSNMLPLPISSIDTLDPQESAISSEHSQQVESLPESTDDVLDDFFASLE